jgi:hypothetical protein
MVAAPTHCHENQKNKHQRLKLISKIAA